MIIIIAVLVLSIAVPTTISIIIHHQQQAFAIQGNTRMETTSSAACGQVVEGFVELNSDLNCSGDGLIIGANGTTISLNDHTIRGPGPDSSKVGISINNQNGVKIGGPGTIEQFHTGIYAAGVEDTTITSLSLTGNSIGAFSTGTGDLKAIQNDFTKNSIGVESHSSNGLQLTKNSATGNTMAAFKLSTTDDSLISKNDVGESENGIFVDAQSNGNRIESNDIHENKVDLNNANGLSTDINQNRYSDNNCETSTPSGLCTIVTDALRP